MLNDQDDLLPADAPLDALLRERVGDDAPPDLSRIIAARHARGEGEAIAARLEQFESPVLRGLQRPLLTAAMVLLGIGAVVGTIWNSNAATDNDPNNFDNQVTTQLSQDPTTKHAVDLPRTVAPPRPLVPVAFQLRVTDRHGGPVQNFEVEVLLVDPRNPTLQPTAALQGIKRQPKDFVDLFTTIQGLQAGATYVAAISDGMHATSMSEPFTPLATETTKVTVQMNSDGELRGIVVDDQGQPIAGVVIATGEPPALRGGLILPGQQPTPGGITTATVASTMTASDGSFAITKLSPGNYQVRYQHRQFCPTVQSDVVIPMGASKPMRITMRPGALVHGTVREDGVPVAGCSLTIMPSTLGSLSMPSESAITTDEHGRYQLTERLPPGSYRILGYPPRVGGGPLRTIGSAKPILRTIRIEPGKDKVEHNIEL